MKHKELVSFEITSKIVAKALDGQRYPLPLCEYMLLCDVRGAAAPKGPMTYAL